MNNKTYWYFTVKIKDSDGDSITENGVAESDNGLFPLRQVEEEFKYDYGNCIIDFKSIVEISKDDYEWKYSEMGKFEKDKGE